MIEIPKEYEIETIPLSISQISFSKFYGKSILDWCLNHCGLSNISGHCPNIKNDFNKKGEAKIKSFKKAYLIFIKVPSKELTWEGYKKSLPAKSQQIIYELLKNLKDELQNSGHKRFLLLAAGPCKKVFCNNIDCELLKNGICSHEGDVFPAMESFGINVFETAETVDKKMYWIQNNTLPESIPYGSRVGLIYYD